MLILWKLSVHVNFYETWHSSFFFLQQESIPGEVKHTMQFDRQSNLTSHAESRLMLFRSILLWDPEGPRKTIFSEPRKTITGESRRTLIAQPSGKVWISEWNLSSTEHAVIKRTYRQIIRMFQILGNIRTFSKGTVLGVWHPYKSKLISTLDTYCTWLLNPIKSWSCWGFSYQLTVF